LKGPARAEVHDGPGDDFPDVLRVRYVLDARGIIRSREILRSVDAVIEALVKEAEARSRPAARTSPAGRETGS
jgi:hypothetical protein